MAVAARCVYILGRASVRPLLLASRHRIATASGSSGECESGKICRGAFRQMGSMGTSGNSVGGIATVIDDVIKSPEDKREYRVVGLENGLKVLLISDSEADKAAASLDVNVGHLSDPWDLPGLAHFCEHMLFLGTKVFPDENEYHKFLADHGGAANAYTSTDHTNYHFDVSTKDLRGALDRFCEFFRSPLFTESATEREVNAVDSENSNYQKNDMWRLIQMERSFSRPDHDYAKFGTGSRDTLWTRPQEGGQNVRTELLKFHSEHYSANAMCLCIVGSESLAELEKLAVERFADVKTNNRSVYEWKDHPWGPEQLGHRLDVVPIKLTEMRGLKDLRSLHLSFPIPDLHPYYRSQPGHYVSHLIGHEGPGSLLSELKRRGWVSSLSSGPRDTARGFAFFNVDVDLSEEGLTHVEDIIRLLFAYIGLLQREGPQEWIHRECQQISANRFRFKEKEKAEAAATSLATALHYFPEKEVLSGPYTMDEYRPDLIDLVMNKLRPDNFSVIVVSNKHKESGDLKKEKWYGTEYASSRLSQAFLSELHEITLKPDPAFHLPAPNKFIPDDFRIKAKDIPLSDKEEVGPVIIEDTPQTRLWYKLDREYLFPKASTYIHLSSPLPRLSPADANLTYMFAAMLIDSLTELTYDASLAGLHYKVENGKYGLGISVRGYSQKQAALLSEIVRRLVNLELDPKRFEVLREAYVRNLRSWAQEQPYKQAMAYSGLLLTQSGFAKEELLQAAEEEDLSVEALKDFMPRFLRRLHLEALAYGNLSESEARGAMDDVWRILRSAGPVRPLTDTMLLRDHELKIPVGDCLLLEKQNPVHENCALEFVLQTGIQGRRENMLLELFAQIIAEPAFDTLRTKECLGYIVFAGLRRSNGTQALRFIIQGEKDPEYVEARVELFLQAMRQKVLDMPTEELETAKESLATQRLEKPKKMSARAARFWSEICSQQYDFNRDEDEVAELRKLSKGDLLAFVDSYLTLGAERRRKLVTGVRSATAVKARESLPANADYQATLRDLHVQMPLAKRIKNMVEWKMYQSTFGIPAPARPVPPMGLCPKN